MSDVSRNRLGNTGNGYQGHFKRVLCVCSAGMLRSPTLAEVLSKEPFGFNTRAVGTDSDFALVPLDLVHLAWADEIVCMSQQQREVIKEMQAQLDDYSRGMVYYEHAPIHVYDIPDDYGFRDPTLVKLLFQKSIEVFHDQG